MYVWASEEHWSWDVRGKVRSINDRMKTLSCRRKRAYEISACLVGSGMGIRDRVQEIRCRRSGAGDQVQEIRCRRSLIDI